MKFRSVRNTTLNGRPVAVGTVVSSNADLRCHSKDWVLVNEESSKEVQVIKPRISRIKK